MGWAHGAPNRGLHPRRDSDSWVNSAVGGRIYPGRHHLARFEVEETDEKIRVAYAARDGSAQVDVSVQPSDELRGSRLFADLAAASSFFEAGSIGYSATGDPERFEGLALKTSAWKIEAATVNHVHSSFFGDQGAIPTGLAELDSALLVRNVQVVWEPLADLQNAKRIAA